jgi:predicted dehydrogenase
MAIKTAVIGLGIMGRRMLENMERHPGYGVVAIFDPDPASHEAAQLLSPAARVVATADEAIATADLVYIACPPAPRKAYALAAAASGKAVFLEKPLGIDIAESEALVDGLASSGVPAAVNFTQAAGAAMTGVARAAADGMLGKLVGADILLNYAAWPRAWQQQADWLRFRDEGGMTREVISHFLFFCERIFGPLSIVWARPTYPADAALCETHMQAMLATADGLPVTVMASVGGAQPDRQELTIKGTRASRRITDFYVDAMSDGADFAEIAPRPADPRAASLKAQLDDLLLCIQGAPNRLATPKEALSVQKLIEGMLEGQV